MSANYSSWNEEEFGTAGGSRGGVLDSGGRVKGVSSFCNFARRFKPNPSIIDYRGSDLSGSSTY